MSWPGILLVVIFQGMIKNLGCFFFFFFHGQKLSRGWPANIFGCMKVDKIREHAFRALSVWKRSTIQRGLDVGLGVFDSYLMILPVYIYYLSCGNNKDFISRVHDGKGSYSHAQVDPVTDTKISGQLFFHRGSVSWLCSHRRGIALLTRVNSWKEKKKKSCSFSKAVLRLLLKRKLSVMLGPTQSEGWNIYDFISDLYYESPVCHSIK